MNRKLIFLVLLAVMLTGCGPGEEFFKDNECLPVLIYQRALTSLVLSDSFEGVFLFGSGRIGSELNYTFTEVLEDGGKYTREVGSDIVVRYEDALGPDNAYVQYYESHTNGNVSSGTCHGDITRPSVIPYYKVGWFEVHIPPGSEVIRFDTTLP